MEQVNYDLRLFTFDYCDNINGPIQKYSRIKYTCFDASANHVAFGSTSGGIYLFSRHDNYELKFSFVIPQSEGKITCISFCPHDGNLIAFTTNNGTLMVVELHENVESSKGSTDQWDKIYVANNFTGNYVTILKWDAMSDHKLFMADQDSNLYCIGKLRSLSHLLVSPEPTLLLRTTSQIADFDISGSVMVISTLERALVFDIDDGTVDQVGKKSRPVGQYAVCLFPREIRGTTVYKCIYASRPGCRIWEADFQGNVQFTHQFKPLLANAVQSSVLSPDQLNLETPNEPETFVPCFSQFHVIHAKNQYLLVAYTKEPNGLCIIDPVKATVRLWTRLFDDIKQIKCVGSDIFLFGAPNGSNCDQASFRRISLFTLTDCLLAYVHYSKLVHINGLLESHHDELTNAVKVDPVLKAQLNNKFTSMWAELSESEKNQCNNLLEEMLCTAIDDANLANDQESESKENAFLTQFQAHQISLRDNSFSDDLMTDDLETKYFKMSISMDDVIPFTKFIPNPLNAISNKGMVSFSNAKQGFGRVIDKANKMAGFNQRSTDSTANGSVASSSEGCDSRPVSEVDTIDSLEIKDTRTSSISSEDEPLPEKERMAILMQRIKAICRHYRCECGYPLPKAHRVQFKEQEKLALLLNSSESYTQGDRIGFTLDGGLWRSHCDLLIAVKDYLKYAKIALMLDDVALLRSSHFLAALKDDQQMRSDLVNLFVDLNPNPEQKTMTCLNCYAALKNVEALTFTEFAKYLLDTLGAQEGLKLLKEHSAILSLNTLPIDFYLSIIRKEVVSKYQSSLTLNKLSQLNDKLKVNRKKQSKR
ncbi:Hermansky-Pudlak syndrome 5 -like protein [Halotydeus destructor]|nr:Hermansky-Pudlak syndrome 5 -like protein [Halotydeus destructor]